MADAITFLSLVEAQTAIVEIDESMKMPITSRNSATGELQPLKQKTITWSNVEKVDKQSKWFVLDPGSKHTSKVAGATKEVFDKSWRPAGE